MHQLPGASHKLFTKLIYASAIMHNALVVHVDEKVGGTQMDESASGFVKVLRTHLVCTGFAYKSLTMTVRKVTTRRLHDGIQCFTKPIMTVIIVLSSSSMTEIVVISSFMTVIIVMGNVD